MASSEQDGPEGHQANKRRAWSMRIGGVVVSLVALAIVFATNDVGAAWDVLREADIRLLLVVFAVMAAQLLVRGQRWSILLPRRPDGSRVPVTRTLVPLLVGYLGNAILPARLGEPIRAYLVARRERLDALTSFGATVLERVLDLTMLAAIGLVAALALGLPWWIVGVAALAAGVGGVVLGLLVVVGSIRLVDIGTAVLSRLGLAGRTERLQAWARSFAGGLDRGRDPARMGAALGLSLLAWALDALIFWLVGQALGIELSYAEAVVVGAVAVLATAVPSAPGYVGTFELAATSAGAAVGIPEAQALALAVLVHLITLVPMALAGAVAVVATGSSLGRLADEAEHVELEAS